MGDTDPRQGSNFCSRSRACVVLCIFGCPCLFLRSLHARARILEVCMHCWRDIISTEGYHPAFTLRMNAIRAHVLADLKVAVSKQVSEHKHRRTSFEWRLHPRTCRRTFASSTPS